MAGTSQKTKVQILSHTSILIFSAFLIGIIVHDMIPQELKIYSIAAAAVGLLSYLALDFVAGRRKEQEARDQQEQLESLIDRRMKRHQEPVQRSKPAAGS